ncbi:MAG: C-GCAxxG-C-C family protein [Candidatus Neomarinimicrobiota bacterium]
MDRINQATKHFENGHSCSQAILMAYAEELGLTREQALKLASGFGGGMAHQDGTCGAVTGAMLVLGAKYGYTTPGPSESKEKTYEIIQCFTRAMTRRFNTTICTEMIGFDLSTPAGLAAARQDQVFQRLCPGFVRAAAEILAELVAEHGL